MEKLKSEKQILDSLLIVNNQRLNQKKKEASQVIELDSLKNVLVEISELITNANKQIDEHNKIIQNLSHEKRTLTNQIWKFILEELKQDLADYSTQKASLEKAISGLSTQITKKEKEKAEKFRELLELEKQTTSIQPTLDGINALLSSFGFKSFSLAKGGDGKTYKLVRANGADAQRTLSEGEKNFVTFLYFYHLLKGSQSESGITTDRVVAIDDPVSSLDNDVLFIISSLIRDLIEDVRNNKGNIKQVFILTHNIYFHKEVTYNSK
ncbi:MAG: AAA family ATPase, partial [Peptococcaceae bacterium]|nr:AAA family ATPase [Peptococcaceae bacterium]